jgi:hypothetical protein
MEGEFDNDVQEKFSEILSDIAKEREMHDKDDTGFVISEELNIIEAHCFFGL